MPPYKKSLPEKDREVIVDEMTDIVVSTAARVCRIADDFNLDRDYLMVTFAAYIESTVIRGTWKGFDPNHPDKDPVGL